MKTIYYKIKNKRIRRIDEDIDKSLWQRNLDWVDVCYSDINKVFDFLSFLPFIKDNKNFINKAEINPIPRTHNNYIIQNFIISQKDNIYKSEYFTLIILKDLIIRIIPIDNTVDIDTPETEHSISLFKDIRFYYVYKLMTEIIAKNISSLIIAKKKLHTLENKLINKPDELSSGEVMSNHTEIGQLADIIEDQHVSFSVFNTIFEEVKYENDIKWLLNRDNGFKELTRMTERLEEKAESFRFQFMMIQQEASTRKINILTIVQAVFVPLTFITGVYGMNFKYMPELDGEYSYYAVWSLFVFISVILIYFFKKDKWFE